MLAYVARRLLVAIPMLFGAMSIVFFAMRVLPGDPCVAMMGDQATTEALADCTKNLGLERPLVVQYVDYLWRSARFDFGNSFRQGYPVSEYIGRMFPHTLILVLASAVVAALVGVPAGIASALKRRSPLIDYPLRIFALLGLSMPVFWLGILLLIVFSLRLDLFPLIGGGDLDAVIAMIRSGEAFTAPGDFFAAVLDVLHHLTLPAVALGFTLAATVSRLSRSAMLEVISQDYIRTARAKGLLERMVVYKHALRNMMVPLLTIIGLFVAVALTGTVLTETVFTRPGLGKMLVDAIGARDYPLAQGAITVFTMIIISVNLVVDMLYAVVDPRITYR
jgi:peptide/nickel transport system permease protein